MWSDFLFFIRWEWDERERRKIKQLTSALYRGREKEKGGNLHTPLHSTHTRRETKENEAKHAFSALGMGMSMR